MGTPFSCAPTRRLGGSWMRRRRQHRAGFGSRAFWLPLYYFLTPNPWTSRSVADSRFTGLARSLNLNSPLRTRNRATGHETMANGLARTLVHDVSHDALQMLIKTCRWPNRDLAWTLRPAGLTAPSPTAPLRLRPPAQAQESELARGFDHVINIPPVLMPSGSGVTGWPPRSQGVGSGIAIRDSEDGKPQVTLARCSLAKGGSPGPGGGAGGGGCVTVIVRPAPQPRCAGRVWLTTWSTSRERRLSSSSHGLWEGHLR